MSEKKATETEIGRERELNGMMIKKREKGKGGVIPAKLHNGWHFRVLRL